MGITIILGSRASWHSEEVEVEPAAPRFCTSVPLEPVMLPQLCWHGGVQRASVWARGGPGTPLSPPQGCMRVGSEQGSAKLQTGSLCAGERKQMEHQSVHSHLKELVVFGHIHSAD
ncbi:hypothetical protein EYF80_044714 [Liparis tanakae]|uniref:Uncharacterized protein n=1 Tax=Liparis tanakae TaxID=230148 RepID=A0A4Z2FW16_9TELE|nr:hypothetical protein EYF80_044714 [Liparis tanakae]